MARNTLARWAEKMDRKLGPLPQRADDRRKAANSESRSSAFGSGYQQQYEVHTPSGVHTTEDYGRAVRIRKDLGGFVK